jgi:hypothetical protein
MIIDLALFIAFASEIYRHFYPEVYTATLSLIIIKLHTIKTELEPKLIEIGYNAIYYYSRCQIYFNKGRIYFNIILRSFINFLRQHNLINNIQTSPIKFIEFYKNGKKIDYLVLNSNICQEIDYSIDEQNNYDLLILSDNPNTVTNCVNKMLIQCITYKETYAHAEVNGKLTQTLNASTVYYYYKGILILTIGFKTYALTY